MKVVLDTNVLIAALISNGVCSDVLEHCVQRHTLVGSEFILSELRDHLANKFHYTSHETEVAINLLQSSMEMVVPVVLEFTGCRDSDDVIILATAIAGNAECIITGDKDLLVMQRFQTVMILRPTEFTKYEAGKST